MSYGKGALRRNRILPSPLPIKKLGRDALKKITDERVKRFITLRSTDKEYDFLKEAHIPKKEYFTFFWDEVFTITFNKLLKPYRIELRWKESLEPQHLSGEYDREEDRIVVYLGAEGLRDIKKGIHPVYSSWKEFFWELEDIIMHEFIHKEQHARAGGIYLQHQSYFERPEEMMAYARDIASELEKEYGTEGALRKLRGKRDLPESLKYYKTQVSLANYKRLLKSIVWYLERQ